MSGVVLAAVHGSHITTSFLRDRLKPAHQRFLAIFVWAVVAGLYATLCIATYKMLDIVKDEKSPVLGVPGSVTYGCVLLGMFLLCILAIKDCLTAIKTPALVIAASNAAAQPNTNY
jgi:TRAP-type C4-dicarboxylate transport system permease small subunit